MKTSCFLNRTVSLLVYSSKFETIIFNDIIKLRVMKSLSELQDILLKQCYKKDIRYALVIVSRENGEIRLTPTITEAIADSKYCVLEAKKTDSNYLIKEIMK